MAIRRLTFVLICFFNYRDYSVRKLPLDFDIEEPLHISRVGYEYGLSVVINQSLADYSHTYNDFVGTQAFLFGSTDYLDEISGSVVSRILQSNEELFISVNVVPVFGSESMRPHSPELRECFFEDESPLRRYSLA